MSKGLSQSNGSFRPVDDARDDDGRGREVGVFAREEVYPANSPVYPGLDGTSCGYPLLPLVLVVEEEMLWRAAVVS